MTVTTLVLLTAVPAHADATARDGRIGLSVRGKGLTVTRASGHLDGHGTGVRARLIGYTPAGYRSELTGWKDATPVSAAMTKISAVGWEWKGGRRFADGSKLCVEFNSVEGEPCAVIHR
ncbi:hypothetical protein ACFRSX_31060 [Streptomyces goshikiensis]|uniref:hypothetical protein n=1 Tax=Streptomyces TaxID=1883 RepID=UPI00131B1305|nr:hypothetical protein [Streptomyces sp. CB02120-2]